MTPAGPFAGPSDRTMPIPAVAAVPHRARSGAARLAVVVACGVLALVVTATTAVVLVVRGTAPATPVVATVPAAAPAPAATPVVAPVVATEPGPALVDTSGDAVGPELTTVVTRVYRALDANDLEPVRRAYSAAGSDDWFTSEPLLRSANVRNRVLATLRERPSAHDGYLYASDNGHMIQVGRGVQYARPGLLSIRGPWSYESTPVAPEPTVPAASAPVTSSPEPWNLEGCAAGTVEVPTEGHPCQDPDTGRGVDRDGTVGVHGLKPCPYGTTVPSDPDEPTRNSSTGEVCGI